MNMGVVESKPSGADDESGHAAAGNLIDSISARDRRTLAIRFLRSKDTAASLLRRCRGDTPEAKEARQTMACVLLMVQDDAPQDLVMTDPGLYAVLRQRITDIRLAGWCLHRSERGNRPPCFCEESQSKRMKKVP